MQWNKSAQVIVVMERGWGCGCGRNHGQGKEHGQGGRGRGRGSNNERHHSLKQEEEWGDTKAKSIIIPRFNVIV